MSIGSGRDVLCLLPRDWGDGRDRAPQLLRRLASTRRVVAVEEAVVGATRARLRLRCEDEGLVVATPFVPRGGEAAKEAPLATIDRLVTQVVERVGLRDPWLWCTRPDHAPIALRYRSGPVLYDRADEWPWPTDFPPNALRAWDDVLATQADVLVSDGPGLPRGVSESGARRHLVRSGLDDVDPRRRALEPRRRHEGPLIAAAGLAPEQRDDALLAGLALARPEWRFIVDADPSRGVSPPNTLPVAFDGAGFPTVLRGCDLAMIPARPHSRASSRLWRLVGGLLARAVPVVTVPVPDLVTSLHDEGVPLRFAEGVSEYLGAATELLRVDRDALTEAALRLRARWTWDAAGRELARLLDAGAPAHVAMPASRSPPPIEQPL